MDHHRRQHLSPPGSSSDIVWESRMEEAAAHKSAWTAGRGQRDHELITWLSPSMPASGRVSWSVWPTAQCMYAIFEAPTGLR